MKLCHKINDKLVAYIHGELNEADTLLVKTHIDACTVCEAELEMLQSTLSLLGETLEMAPAPEELGAWRVMPHRVSVRRKTLADFWYSPKLRATLATAAVACIFLMISVSFVAVTVLHKPEQEFAAKIIERPTIQLKKLRVPVKAQKKSATKPKLTKRVMAESRFDQATPDIKIPEMMGVKGGVGDSAPTAADIAGIGFTMPETDYFAGTSSGGKAKIKASEKPLSDSESLPDVALASARNVVNDFTMPEIKVFGVKAPAKAEKVGLLDADISESPMIAGNSRERTRSSTADTESEGLADFFGDAPAEGRRRTPEPAVFNAYMLADENAFSTFSIDVDTASYGLARKQLLEGGLPEPETVRTEEFINSFDYDYRPPTGKQTFAVHSERAPSPFRTNMDVLKIGIKGRRIGRDDHRGAVLTLVIDTSGSMATPERLGLVKQSIALLVDALGPNDIVAIVQFGSEALLVLEHTPASDKAAIMKAIDALQPGGPTQFDKGLELGYQLAKSGFSAGDSNRIMILSDGVANLGELDPEAILEQVAEQRQKGIYLSVLGFGSGTYDDDLLEKLANRGDGMYVYIDTLNEAQSLLVDNLAATLHVIASDVKIQVEFNPAWVLRYRQLGYENRQLTKEQFRDDTVDAGEVGSGQSVTALYDVELKSDGPENEPIATVYVRYRRADNGAVEEISSRVMSTTASKRFEDASPRFQLAVCTAEFAEKLRRSPYAEGTELRDVSNKLQPAALALDLDEQVQELVRLINRAERLR